MYVTTRTYKVYVTTRTYNVYVTTRTYAYVITRTNAAYVISRINAYVITRTNAVNSQYTDGYCRYFCTDIVIKQCFSQRLLRAKYTVSDIDNTTIAEV